EALYEASQAGVEVDLIVRGICILKPQVPNLSENIRVRSIIGRLLEHSRVFYFYNNGVENTYISSADWMSRNMFGRVETCVPILNQEIKRRVINESFTIALKDNQRAWEMFGDGSYKRVPFDEKNDKTVNLHDELFSLLGSN
ncbi:MAG: RNA degradosome polyphosphate kinase, partial [Neisseriaceae bacterium]|nr:RNA degradosome polyphosphate kinase [Neisseriaceae bacterium]